MSTHLADHTAAEYRPASFRASATRVIGAVLVAGLALGMPVALASLGRPIPAHWPSAHRLARALTAPIPDTFWPKAFDVAGWISWGFFVVTLAVSGIRHFPTWLGYRREIQRGHGALARRDIAADFAPDTTAPAPITLRIGSMLTNAIAVSQRLSRSAFAFTSRAAVSLESSSRALSLARSGQKVGGQGDATHHAASSGVRNRRTRRTRSQTRCTPTPRWNEGDRRREEESRPAVFSETLIPVEPGSPSLAEKLAALATGTEAGAAASSPVNPDPVLAEGDEALRYEPLEADEAELADVARSFAPVQSNQGADEAEPTDTSLLVAISPVPERSEEPISVTPPPLEDGMVEIALLGPVEIVFGDARRSAEEVLREGLGKMERNSCARELELLVYLATHPKGADAEKLRDVLSRDSERSLSRGYVYNLVARLRKVMEEATGLTEFISSNEVSRCYQLSAKVTTDVSRVESLVRKGDIDSARLALALVRGRLLGDAYFYSWLDEDAFPNHVSSLVVDGASTIASYRHSRNGDPEFEWALGKARLLVTSSEELREMLKARVPDGSD